MAFQTIDVGEHQGAGEPINDTGEGTIKVITGERYEKRDWRWRLRGFVEY